ncbi:hypothetical protein [Methylovirgula sp. 4M-Z18]|uniref:hypothetical protein n=1 Tax=Methylovirgula sp. 4M-Z18 TaxID=2293567 RepID=UPI0011C05A0C|nr:hypothetical protein [Methylovirgula sp. 4M-Z18]
MKTNTLLRFVCIFLTYIAIFLIYMSNGVPIWSGDTYDSSIFSANIIQNGTIFFDAATHGSYYPVDYYFFAPTTSGHIGSTYPLLPQLFFFPFNFLYYFLDGSCKAPVFSEMFENCRLHSDKFSSAALASLTVLIYFFTVSGILKRTAWAVLASVFFAFGTNHFVTASQSNWQHDPIELLCIILIYITTTQPIKADTNRFFLFRIYALFLIIGLLIWIRLSNVIWILPILTWSWTERRGFMTKSAYITATAGLVAGLSGFFWNYSLFGSFLGGYARLRELGMVSFTLSLEQFETSFSGLMWSASRGLLIITPVAALGIIGWPLLERVPAKLRNVWVKKTRQNKNFEQFSESERMENALGRRSTSHVILVLWGWYISVAALIVLYSFYQMWWAGWAHGARFMTDAMPVFILLAAIVSERTHYRIVKIAFVLLGLIGVCNQFAMVYGASGPAGHQFDVFNISGDDVINVRGNELIYRNWHDSDLTRSYISIYSKIFRAPQFWATPAATQNSAACIVSISGSNQTFDVRNAGSVDWIGYEGGSPNPPRIEFESGHGRRVFLLRDRIIRPGHVGRFIDLKQGPAETSLPSHVLWGESVLPSLCQG